MTTDQSGVLCIDSFSNGLGRLSCKGTFFAALLAMLCGNAGAADLVNTSGTISGSYDSAQIGYRASGITDTVGSGNSLSIGSGSTNYLLVGVSYNGTGGTGTLDASLASSLTINVSNLYVGICAFYEPVGPGSAGGGAVGTGTLKLGANNTITVNSKLQVGGGDIETNTGMNGGNAGTVITPASSTTTIYTPYMALGTSKGNTGVFTLGSGAALNLSAVSGGRTELILGRKAVANNNENRTVAGTMDLSGGVASLTLSALRLSYNMAGLTGGYLDGSMTLSANPANHLDVKGAGNVIQIGYANGASGSFSSGSMTDTLTIGNLDAASVVESEDNSTAILIGQKPAGATATVIGKLTLNGGMLTIKTTGSAIAGGNGASTINLKDCTLVAGASSTNWITGLTAATLTNTVTFSSGTHSIAVPQGFSGNGSLVKAGTGTMTLSGTNTYTGATTVSNGTLMVNGVITSAVTVVSDGAFGGTGTISNNVTLLSGGQAVFTQGSPMTITGSLVLNDNVVRVNLPGPLEAGALYPLATYNPTGSTGEFALSAVVDSGVASGVPTIITDNGTVYLRIVRQGAIITIQ